MNLLRSYILSLVLFLPVSLGFGQVKEGTPSGKDTLKLSVAQAQQYALENNQSILNANLDVEAAKKKVWETTAIGLPQVSAAGTFTYTPELTGIVEQLSGFNQLFSWMYEADQALKELTTVLPNNDRFGFIQPPSNEVIDPNDMKWSLSGTLTVSQLIFSGSYLVGLQSAKVYKSLSVLNQSKSKQDIMESVVNSYFNVLIARENRMIMDSTYKNLLKTFSDTKAMNEAGYIEETDVDQMQITLSTLKSSLDFITRMESITEKMLKIQLGLDLNAPVVLTDSLKPLIDALTIEPLLQAEFILENNVNYQLLDASVKSSRLLMKLRQSEFLPDLAAFYQYQKEFNDKAFTFTPPHLIGVSLNIPIFSSGSRLAKVSQAKIDLIKAQNTMQMTGNSLRLEYETGKSALISAYEKYETQSVNLGLAEKIYKRALIKYTNGIISGTELNQIQSQFLTAQSNYFTAIQDLIAAKSKLEKTITKNN